MSDDWDKPTAPVKSVTTPAPGTRKGGPIEPRLALEPVEIIDMDPEELKTIEELRYQNRRLRLENDALMKQIEDVWAVIRTRDQQLEQMQGGR